MCGVGPLPLLEALTAALSQSLHSCDGRAVGEVAWALSVLRFRSEQCLAALFDVTSDLGSFPVDALTKILWCLDSFGKRAQTEDLALRAARLMDASHSEASGRLKLLTSISILGSAQTLQGDFDQQVLQPLATSLSRLASGAAFGPCMDLPAPHLGPRHTARALRALGVQVSTFENHNLPNWVVEARTLVAEVFGEEGPLPMLPVCKEKSKIPVVDQEAYAESITRFGVDNFGKIGGRCLMNQLGIGRAEETWLQKVKQFLRAWTEGVGRASSDWKAQTAHRRIYAFAEFSFESTFLPGKPLLEGTMLQLNGLHADPEFTFRPWLCVRPPSLCLVATGGESEFHIWRRRMVRKNCGVLQREAVQLPISKWVDRSQGDTRPELILSPKRFLYPETVGSNLLEMLQGFVAVLILTPAKTGNCVAGALPPKFDVIVQLELESFQRSHRTLCAEFQLLGEARGSSHYVVQGYLW
ncbi:unnamed protein product [Symbiodinium natans]|uniref:Uncharacterized protein n=1 Tax=Symbiodinium natans TaxID=878477 RepID=A0A812I7R7_9DINO|nr:unnamed protein product [Symbiodinium natans]